MSKAPSGHWNRVFKNIEISKLCFSCNGWPQFGSEHSFFRDELDILTSSGGSTSSFSTATAVESHTIRGYPEAFWQPEVLEQLLPKHYSTKHYQNWICHEHQLLPNITKPHVVKICWSPTIVQCFRLFQESPSGPDSWRSHGYATWLDSDGDSPSMIWEFHDYIMQPVKICENYKCPDCNWITVTICPDLSSLSICNCRWLEDAVDPFLTHVWPFCCHIRSTEPQLSQLAKPLGEDMFGQRPCHFEDQRGTKGLADGLKFEPASKNRKTHPFHK